MGNSINGSDPEMLELFRAEMDTHLPVLSRGLLALDKGQVSAQEIDAMMRAAHSIKGAARIVGIEPAVRVSHIMEDCFTAARESRITLTCGSVDVLLEGLDALQRICDPRDGQLLTEPSLQVILAKIASVRDGSPAVASPKPAAESASPLPGKLVAATVGGDASGITMPAVWDDGSIATLRREMLDTLSLRPGKIRLDFTHVEELTASALAILASFAREAQRGTPPSAVQAGKASDSVRAVLRVGGLGGDLGLDSPV